MNVLGREIEEKIDEFEATWSSERNSHIRDYIPDQLNNESRCALIVELILSDVYFQRKSFPDEVWNLERYLKLYPEIKAEPYLSVLKTNLLQPGPKVYSGIPPDTRLGEFVIVKLLGSGGMGDVYEAIQSSTERKVALKVLRHDFRDEKFGKRFEKEAKILGKMNHQNIAKVICAGVAESAPYLALELIEGRPLQSGMKLKAAVQLVSKMAKALQYAHEEVGVIHRDVKPSNILVKENGEPILIDFGLGHVVGGESLLTRTKDQIGTPSFAPPEQLDQERFGPSTPKSDVYGLGATLHYLLLGSPPFYGNPNAVVYQVLTQEPIEAVKIDPTLPANLNTIITTCLRKHQDQRYSSMNELSCDLDLFLSGQPIKRKPQGHWSRFAQLLVYHKLITSLIFTILCLSVTIAIVSVTSAARQGKLVKDLKHTITAQSLTMAKRAFVEKRQDSALAGLLQAAALSDNKKEKAEIERLIGNWVHTTSACFRNRDHIISFCSKEVDGKGFLLTVGDRGWVRLWDFQSRELIEERLFSQGITKADFLPSSESLLVLGKQELYIWDRKVNTVRVIESEDQLTTCWISPADGNILVGTAGGKLVRYDLQGNFVENVFSGQPFKEVVYEPSLGDYIALVGKEVVYVLNVNKNFELVHEYRFSNDVSNWSDQLREIANSIMGTQFTPDGKFLVAGRRDGLIGIWNVATGKQTSYSVLQKAGVTDLRHLRLSCFGANYIMISCSNDSSVIYSQINQEGMFEEKNSTRFKHGFETLSLAPADVGLESVYCADSDGSIFQVAKSPERKVAYFKQNRRIHRIERFQNSLVSIGDDGVVRAVSDLESAIQYNVKTSGVFDSVDVSKDGKMGVAGKTGNLLVFDPMDGNEIFQIKTGLDRLFELRIIDLGNESFQVFGMALGSKGVSVHCWKGRPDEIDHRIIWHKELSPKALEGSLVKHGLMVNEEMQVLAWTHNEGDASRLHLINYKKDEDIVSPFVFPRKGGCMALYEGNKASPFMIVAESKVLKQYDLVRREWIRSESMPFDAEKIEISPCGKFLAVLDGEKQLRILDAATFDEKITPFVFARPCYKIAFSNDSRDVVVLGSDWHVYTISTDLGLESSPKIRLPCRIGLGCVPLPDQRFEYLIVSSIAFSGGAMIRCKIGEVPPKQSGLTFAHVEQRTGVRYVPELNEATLVPFEQWDCLRYESRDEKNQ